MNFTSQQLTGGAKYSHAVRIGNWSEDLEIEEIRLKDYLKRKDMGKLLVISRQLLLERALLPAVAATQLSDGKLRFGDTVMFRNQKSECFLGGNREEAIAGKATAAFAVTTGPNDNPCVRNVFRIEPVAESDSNVLCFGSKFRLRLMAAEGEDGSPAPDLYLASEPINPVFTGAASKYSRKQEVMLLNKKNDGGSIWQFLHPDTRKRFETEGQEIDYTSAEVVIRHTQTGSYLASDKIVHKNIFGTEYEVHCHGYFSTNKTHNLYSEQKGLITGDWVLRRHDTPNKWTILSNVKGLGGSQKVAEKEEDIAAAGDTCETTLEA